MVAIFHIQGTARDDFHLEGQLDIGMKVQGAVEMEATEVAGAMAGVTLMAGASMAAGASLAAGVSLVAGASLAAGVAIEPGLLAAEMDIRGLITPVTMVGVLIVLVEWLLMLQPEVQHHGYLLLPDEQYFAGRIGGEAFWWIYQVIGFFSE